MEIARQWLESAGAFRKDGEFEPSKLGPEPVIAKTAVNHLRSVQDELRQTLPKQKKGLPDLIPIAIEDMKIINQLIKLSILYGIYPCLPQNAKSRLTHQVKPWQVPRIFQEENPLLGFVTADTKAIQDLVKNICDIIRCGDDVSNQVFISGYLPYLMWVLSFTPDEFNSIANMFPTYHLYKLLLQLMVLDPSNVVAKYKITSLTVERHDSVRCLIEILFRPGENDDIELDHIQQAVLVLSSPTSVPAVKYIEALGVQIFSLLVSPNKFLNEAAALIVQRLALIQPRLVGKLRNMIVDPFEMKGGGRVSQSLLALYRLATYANRKQSNMFAQHLCDKLSISLWLLAVTACEDDGIPESIVHAMVAVIQVTPQCIVGIVESLLIKSLPGNLTWNFGPQGEPQLITTITRKVSDNKTMLQRIDERLDCLVCVFRRLNDASATKSLILLMQLYTLESSRSGTNGVSEAINTLLQAKTIERLTQDEEIKTKLFDKPSAIVDFAFSVITPKLSGSLKCSSQPDTPTVEQNQNPLELEIGDSDDDDDDDDDDLATLKSPYVSEDHTMLDLALSLLGTSIMESLADDKNSFNLTDEQKSMLNNLATNTALPKHLRARADFCRELINGGTRMSQTLNTSNDADVLKAAHEALAEPLVPSRAYGIHLISNLLGRNAITLNEAMECFMRELNDEDSYIYLNALKAIEAAGNTQNTTDVIQYLIPLIGSNNAKNPVDVTLRVREAVIRLLTPGSLHSVSSELITVLANDITSQAKKSIDYRFRLSSAAILGIIISHYPLSVSPEMQTFISDCALGILRHEKSRDDTALRRSAAVLTLELINAVNSESNFNVPQDTLKSLKLEMESIVETSSDITLVEHCKAVLECMKL